MARGNSKCGAGFRLRSGRRLACYNHRVSSGRQPEGAPIWVAVAVAVLVVVIVSAILLPGFIRTYLELAEAERPHSQEAPPRPMPPVAAEEPEPAAPAGVVYAGEPIPLAVPAEYPFDAAFALRADGPLPFTAEDLTPSFLEASLKLSLPGGRSYVALFVGSAPFDHYERVGFPPVTELLANLRDDEVFGIIEVAAGEAKAYLAPADIAAAAASLRAP